MKELLKSKHSNQIFTKENLVKILYNVKINKGDIICIHTEIFNLGIPLLSKNELLKNLLECFFEAIGKEGTLIMPTFTYAFCKNGIYDKINSKSEVGILTEYFRKQEGVKRSNDPIFSFAIKGAKEDLFLKDTKTCFGKDCVYDILWKNNGKIILLGTPISTFTHFIEEKAKVPYRYFKNFSGILINEDKIKYEKSIDFYVRKLYKDFTLDIDKQNNILKNSNNFIQKQFGDTYIISLDSQSYLKETISALQNNPYCLLKDF